MTNPLIELAERVEKLTPQQRADILAADESDAYCEHFSRLYGDDLTFLLVEAYPAHHDFDCSIEDEGGTRWSFNETGKAIREYLRAIAQGHNDNA